MKWPLFAISLLALWFAFNMLYMVPGQYTATNFVAAGIGIGVGILTAWLSGRRFGDPKATKRTIGAIMQTPPVVLCLFILFIIGAMAVLKVLAYR